MKEAPSSHLQESSNTIDAEEIGAKSSEGQSQGVKVAETVSNDQEGDTGSCGNHHAPCRVQSFLGDCALEDLEYEKNEVTNVATAKVILESQSSPVRRQLSSQLTVAIDDTIERLLMFEDDKEGVSASEGNGEGNIDNGNNAAKTAPVDRQNSSQVSLAIDDTIKRILFLEDGDKVEASATEAKKVGTDESGNIAAKTGPTHRRPSSQVRMAIDDTIKRILFSEDEGEDVVPSGSEATEGRDVIHEEMVGKIVPRILTDDIIRTHDNPDTCKEEFTFHTTQALEPTEENKTSDGGKSDSDEGLKAPNVSSAQLSSSALITDAHIAAEMFIQEVSMALAMPEKSMFEDGTNVVADESSKAPFVPSAPLASSSLISDAHIATEEFIKEVTLALEIPEKSKVEDGTNVVADENSESPFVPSAPLASSTLISDAHIATEEFIKEVTLALEIPEKSKVEDGTNVVADENSESPFVPSAPLASSSHISDAYIATEEFIKEVTFVLEVPEKSKVEDGTNVVADESSESPFVPFAPLASSTLISDAHIATEEFIKEVTFALEIPEKSKVEDGTNVVADENSESPFVPSAPLASSSHISDAHIATEELIKEVTFAFEIPEKSKVEDGTNVVADENSESLHVPFAPLDSSACISEANIATNEFIQEAALALEMLEKCKMEESNSVAADEKSESPRVPSAPLHSSTVASTAHSPSTLKREGALKADDCVVHDEKTEAFRRSSVRTNN